MMSFAQIRHRLWHGTVDHLDAPLFFITIAIMGVGLATVFSATYDSQNRLMGQFINMAVALGLMWGVAQVPPQKLQQLAVPLYAAGLVLLVATAVFGITRKGATRWLALGPLVIQPSEVLKLATPLMLAWWFQKREAQARLFDFVVAAALLLVPVALVIKQPDLGTALLILAGGLYVIFFAGLSWKLVLPALAVGAVGIVALVIAADAICQPGVDWVVLRDYQC